MNEEKKKDNVYDVIIAGGGPAGLTSGLYLARGGMKTLMVESLSVMGQATMTDTIENYPGIDKIGGFDLIMKIKSQAVKFGLECEQGTVKEILKSNDSGNSLWSVITDSGEFSASSVIVATGAKPKKLNIPGEDDFLGSGVSYCATCDGAFFKEKEIIVIGGGDTAVEEALFLTKFAKKVTIVHRRDRLRALKVIQDRAFANEKIDFLWEAVIEEIVGDNKVEKVIVKSLKEDNKKFEVKCDGVFIFVGWDPNTDFLGDLLDKNDKGRIIVDDTMKTSVDGIYAAGDCSDKLLYQVVTACGDGATAAFAAQHYVETLKGTAYS